jgi:hypothetical protein
VAEEEQRKARLRLKEKTQQMQSQRAELFAAEERAFEQRADAVLQLKASIASVKKRLALNSSTARFGRHHGRRYSTAVQLQAAAICTWELWRKVYRLGRPWSPSASSCGCNIGIGTSASGESSLGLFGAWPWIMALVVPKRPVWARACTGWQPRWGQCMIRLLSTACLHASTENLERGSGTFTVAVHDPINEMAT